MIVLLGCSINSLAQNIKHSSTGELDSVRISYDDLRTVNSKLVELDYTKQINNKLYQIVHNDSIVINNYKSVNNNLNKTMIKYKCQRNITFITTLCAIVGMVVSFIK
jgi:hypothetical protein